jgi:hypothetical protein
LNRLQGGGDKNPQTSAQNHGKASMLSPTALLWTQIAAAICSGLALLLLRAIWKNLRDTSRSWSKTRGKVTISQAGGTPTHPAQGNVAESGVVIRYRYQVGGRDHEGDGAQIGGKSRAMGLMAKALLKNFPEGKEVDVYYDPAEPARSSLQPHDRSGLVPSLVFFVVFGSIGGILTAHAILGKMIMMANGLPLFALALPIAALMTGLVAFGTYFVGRRAAKASAAWPTTPGKIVSARVAEQRERVSDDDGRDDIEITYRPDIRFSYRVGTAEYTNDSWKGGMAVSSGSPKYAESVVARYAAGQSVPVHYNPARPEVAVLEPSNQSGAGVLLACGFAFSLAGLLFMWVMTHGQWVNAATGS